MTEHCLNQPFSKKGIGRFILFNRCLSTGSECYPAKARHSSPFSKMLCTFLMLFLITNAAVAGNRYMATPQDAAAAAELSCPPGLAHYFGFDEKEPGSYLDYVTGASATCTGCPAPAPSMFAGGQRFNGSNTGLTFNQVDKFQWGPNSSFTIEMWVQISGNSSSPQVFIGRDAKDSDMAWWLGMNAEGYAAFDMRDSQGKRLMTEDDKVKIKLNDGKWHHVAFVRDGILRHSKLYVDGFIVRDFLMLDFGGNFESTSPVTIGYLDFGNMFRFNGTMDELMIYDRNLTEQEMRSRYNDGAGSYCGPELIAPVITSEPVTYAVSGQDYRYDVKATGNPKPTFSVVSGPPGMTINPTTGALRWAGTTAGDYEIRIKAANSSGEVEQSFRLAIKNGTEEKAGLLHHWMLNESGGTRYSDFYTPYDAAVIQKTRPIAVKGAVGGGQRFNGKDSGLDITGSPNFNWDSGESFSIELWMRSDSRMSDNWVFIGRDAKDSPGHWWVGADMSGKAAFYLRDISGSDLFVGHGGPQLNNGAWHQVVAVRDGSTGISKLYVDGEMIAEGKHAYINGFASRTPVNIGYMTSGNGYHYQGDLDEVKLFGRAMSDQEIKERFTEVYTNLTEILAFKGRYSDGVVILDWETINEIEVDNFEIERSENEETFTTVGTVKASGTTSSAITYTFTDKTPLKEQAYYRLKMNRTNGTFSYSQTILVQDRSPFSSTFRVYPNPVAGGQEVSIEVSNLKENEEVSFIVTDVSGQRIHSEQIRTDEMGQLQFTLPVGVAMRPGIYNLSIFASNKTLNRKLVVAR